METTESIQDSETNMYVFLIPCPLSQGELVYEREKRNNPRTGSALPRSMVAERDSESHEKADYMPVACADWSTKGQTSQSYEDHVRRKFSASSGGLSKYVLCSLEMLNMAGFWWDEHWASAVAF